jgi:hypothetical protein
MNRKTFLASLAGLAAAPLLAKFKPTKAVQECAAHGGKIKAVMFVNKTDLSIVERCEAIRREAELLAGRNYAFTQGRIHGALDLMTDDENWSE